MENLRTYFIRERGKEDASKGGSGSALTDVKKSGWTWYASLEWLKDHIKAKETFSNLDLSNDETSSIKESNEESKKTHNPPNKKIKFEDKLISVADNLIGKMENMSSSSVPSKVEKTEDGVFSELLVKKLAKIPEGEVKEDLKLEILAKVNKVTFYRPISTWICI